MKNASIDTKLFTDDGCYPNHPYLPAVIYRDCLDRSLNDLQSLLHKNRWSNTWTGSVFEYHHYHSTTHETLAVIEGAAALKLGGPEGKKVSVKKGDVLILPAGVAHKLEDSTSDFQVMGAYPYGKSFDLKTGEKNEYEESKKQIREAPAPSADPILGVNGPLMELWM
ncbi:cupin domain-containing protein [Halobacillus yeomjeoni]|uniref:Cupin domain-containing protein n=1 Tax=Halobacillus yeomjeoni TaxID=311194 RepID=A0A931HWJ8_9BACI|nr:cupin domain-containing protein [Halobacillus yeomjeoni]MBH0231197.1 cupin domain-containing protein [Halobacillus yeomjeoni]